VSGETKWTKGPWTTDGTTVYALGRDGYNRFWANVQKQRRDVTFEEIEANAALMARAPDLYAALERLRAEVITNPAVVLWPESMRDALTDAVAALARARGEVTQ
jgi:L-ascorbate metabolism protein UlaG (beta-lactamase superfamily)